MLVVILLNPAKTGHTAQRWVPVGAHGRQTQQWRELTYSGLKFHRVEHLILNIPGQKHIEKAGYLNPSSFYNMQKLAPHYAAWSRARAMPYFGEAMPMILLLSGGDEPTPQMTCRGSQSRSIPAQCAFL